MWRVSSAEFSDARNDRQGAARDRPLKLSEAFRKLAFVMNDPTNPKIEKWPFFAGDLLLLGTAGWLVFHGHAPLALWEMALSVGAVALGALLGVAPFALEYRGWVRLAQAGVLAESVERLQNLEAVAKHVTAATAQWHGVQDQAAQTQRATKEIADRMTGEAAEFREFLQKANDTERATLRLEVDKLRRAEGEWLQVLVRILDHVFALHGAAVRSAKPEVAQQIGAFQHACHDIARRIGLVPFVAQPGEAFDGTRHKTADGQDSVAADARVKETLGAGIAFQGRLVRPALVVIEHPPVPEESERTALAETVQPTPETEPAPESAAPLQGAEVAPPTDNASGREAEPTLL